MTDASAKFVGLGSSHGDDQAGWLAARGLAERTGSAQYDVRQAATPADLLNWLDGAKRLIVCDGCRGIGEPGAVKRWNWPTEQLADISWSGSHDFPLPAVLQLAERLGRLPVQTEVWGIETVSAKPLAEPCNAVRAAVDRVVDQLAAVAK